MCGCLLRPSRAVRAARRRSKLGSYLQRFKMSYLCLLRLGAFPLAADLIDERKIN